MIRTTGFLSAKQESRASEGAALRQRSSSSRHSLGSRFRELTTSLRRHRRNSRAVSAKRRSRSSQNRHVINNFFSCRCEGRPKCFSRCKNIQAGAGVQQAVGMKMVYELVAPWCNQAVHVALCWRSTPTKAVFREQKIIDQR